MPSNRKLVAIVALAALVVAILTIGLTSLWIRDFDARKSSREPDRKAQGEPEAKGPAEPAATWEGPAFTIHIDASDRSRQVSPTLYGIFFEDINYAGDGGLYGEMVQNRSFEFDHPLFAWSRYVESGGAGTVEAANDRPLSGNNPTYVLLTVEKGGFGVGLSNAGYGGMYVESGRSYDFSIYARAEDAAGSNLSLLVQLLYDADAELARCEISGLGSEWQKHGCTLTASGTSTKARLLVTASERGKVALDMISLFPQDTWKHRENGLRADLAEMLAELEPSFLRFPGGCIVEGGSIENHYRWKNTVLPLEERQVQRNQWANNYYQSFGLGYHEYFLLAEDLGAEPLPVIYAGITSCHGNPPMVSIPDMQEYIDHALDLIEYANGDAETTEWGALRAANGHPEPFNLKYMAIGNELVGSNYYTRYKMIYDAIKEKYPDIQLVFSAGWSPTDVTYHEAYRWLARNGNPADIVDEHMYQAPAWFLSNVNRYDDFDRNGPKVFVGEYAAHGNGRRNNLEAAIAEAAFMTGLERNSDVVVMAAYAPLFGRTGYVQWQPNLIWFDQSRVYGTPSYYVQQMFSRHVGDYVVPTRVEKHETADRSEPRGSILLGTWATQVEYDDVVVTDPDGNVLLSEDFESADSLKRWSPSRGNWSVEGGVLKQKSTDTDVRLFFPEGNEWTDYILTLKARKIGGHEGMLIGFAVQGYDDYYWWNIGGWNNTLTAVERAIGGVKSIVGETSNRTVTIGVWYSIRIEAIGGTYRCYLDDVLIHEWTETPADTLFSVTTYDEESGELIIKVVNAASEAKEVGLSLAGVRSVADTAAIIVLQGDPADENSLQEPNKVVPTESRVTGLGREFTHTFPANSVTVMHIPVEL